MDWDLYLRFAQFAAWLFVGIYSWHSSRQQATQVQVKALEDRIDDLASKSALLDQRLSHHADALEATVELTRELSRLSREFGEMRGELRGVREGMQVITRQYDRIDGYLKQQFT